VASGALSSAPRTGALTVFNIFYCLPLGKFQK